MSAPVFGPPEPGLLFQAQESNEHGRHRLGLMVYVDADTAFLFVFIGRVKRRKLEPSPSGLIVMGRRAWSGRRFDLCGFVLRCFDNLHLPFFSHDLQGVAPGLEHL
jgi:hypothetical protein